MTGTGNEFRKRPGLTGEEFISKRWLSKPSVLDFVELVKRSNRVGSPASGWRDVVLVAGKHQAPRRGDGGETAHIASRVAVVE